MLHVQNIQKIILKAYTFWVTNKRLQHRLITKVTHRQTVDLLHGLIHTWTGGPNCQKKKKLNIQSPSGLTVSVWTTASTQQLWRPVKLQNMTFIGWTTAQQEINIRLDTHRQPQRDFLKAGNKPATKRQRKRNKVYLTHVFL